MDEPFVKKCPSQNALGLRRKPSLGRLHTSRRVAEGFFFKVKEIKRLFPRTVPEKDRKCCCFCSSEHTYVPRGAREEPAAREDAKLKRLFCLHVSRALPLATCAECDEAPPPARCPTSTSNNAPLLLQPSPNRVGFLFQSFFNHRSPLDAFAGGRTNPCFRCSVAFIYFYEAEGQKK